MIMMENKKTYRGEGIYIGRPSLLGNPFEIGVHGEREDVIMFYRQWLWKRILEQAEPRSARCGELIGVMPASYLFRNPRRTSGRFSY